MYLRSILDLEQTIVTRCSLLNKLCQNALDVISTLFYDECGFGSDFGPRVTSQAGAYDDVAEVFVQAEADTAVTRLYYEKYRRKKRTRVKTTKVKPSVEVNVSAKRSCKIKKLKARKSCCCRPHKGKNVYRRSNSSKTVCQIGRDVQPL
jgi:hypothetical protein